MCSMPRKPQRKPKPSAVEVSGSKCSAESFSRSLRKRLAEVLVIVGADGEHASEHARLHLLEARQRLAQGRSAVVKVSPTGAPSISRMPAMT